MTTDELLIEALGAVRLRMELDRVPLWRGNDVPVKQLASDFAQYLYLPRLTSPAVLIDAIADGVSLITWQKDGFAYDLVSIQGARVTLQLEIEAEISPGVDQATVRTVTENCPTLGFTQQGFETGD